METLFLWLVLCLDGPTCKDAQVYQLDSFAGDAAMTDCKKQRKKLHKGMTAGNRKITRMACDTVEGFNKRGIK